MFGLHLFAVGHGATNGTTSLIQSVATGQVAIHTDPVVNPSSQLAVGLGAGAATSGKTGANTPAICLNPLDVTCWLQSAAQWVAQQVVSALQPVIDAIFNSPLNILTQTPPADTYQNPLVITWYTAFLNVVDLALASLIVVGGYNVMVGRELGLPTPSWPSSCHACCWPSARRISDCTSWGSSSTWRTRCAAWRPAWRVRRV